MTATTTTMTTDGAGGARRYERDATHTSSDTVEHFVPYYNGLGIQADDFLIRGVPVHSEHVIRTDRLRCHS